MAVALDRSPKSASSTTRSYVAADELARLIKQEIGLSGLGPGARLGAERELAGRHNVSRWIVRKALERLEHDGLIIRLHGRGGGIFLAPQRVVRDLARLVGLPACLRAQGVEAGTTVLSTDTGLADEALARGLDIESGEAVYRVVRLRLASGIPLSIERCAFRADLFPGLLDQSLVGSLYDLLEAVYELKRGDATESLEAVAADRERAVALQVSEGFPLLAVTRQARNTSGQVFEFSQEYYRGDRISIIAHTQGTTELERRLVGAVHKGPFL